MSSAHKRSALFIACAVGALLIAFALTQKPASLDDFRPFYRAGNLLGSPDLFAQTQFHAKGLMFLRTPFYAALLHPLTVLSYATAHALWTALMAACFAAFLILWPTHRSRIALAACWSVPILMALAMAQDIALLLLIAAVATRLWQRDRPVAAGLVASLLALKVTLLLPVAVVFLARSRRGLFALLAGAAAQLALCFVIQGPGWIQQYLAAVRSPLLDQVPARMPCFAAFVSGAPLAVLAAAVYAWIFYIARRENIAAALAAALPLGLIAAPHCYAYDMAAALPLLAAAAGLRSARGILAALALSPVPYLLMSLDHPGPAGAALLIAAVLVSAARMPRIPDATMARTDGPECPNSPSWFPRLTSAKTFLP
jgi:Glycosyltransferase family 87